MNRIFLSAAVLALSAGAALAADLPYRKGPPVLPPPPPPPPIWTGFYAGLNAGYGFGTSNSVTTVGAPLLDAAADPHWGDTGSAWGFSALANTGFAHINQNGFIGGGQVGYNYQWGPSFVIGIEADMQGAGISGSGMSVGQAGSGAPNWTNHGRHDIFFTATGVNNIQAGVDWMGTVRGRLGYLVMPTLLVYATGGLSYGGVHANVQSQLTNVTLTYPNYYSNPTQDFNYGMPTFGVGQRRSQVNVGWNAGGGFEWMFMPNWSVKAEAFYYDLGRLTVGGFTGALDGDYYFYSGRNSNNPAFLNVTSTRVSYQGVVARAGLNYHFNWGNSAPVVAQY